MVNFEDQENFIENVTLALSEFLKEGNKIRTKFSNGSEWITNTILQIYKDTFEMNLKVSYVINNISRGNTMSFKYNYDSFEYVLNGTVDEINLYENIISIHIKSKQKYSNRRKDIRYDVSLCSYVIHNYNEKPIYALLQNISKGGSSFESKADLTVGETIGLNIFVSKDNIISVMGKILRKNATPNNFAYDIQFITFKPESIKLFDELLSVLEKFDDELFYNYIRALNEV